MTTNWFEYLGNVTWLKRHALDLNEEAKTSGWFSAIRIKSKLKAVLDEIEYQEGRKQYANRPFVFPPARISQNHDYSCKCGCWLNIRKQEIGI